MALASGSLDPLPLKVRVTHAQNREDIIIAGFFPEVEIGHYVDIGAGHPTELSVTKSFYDRGWSGINVEPIPELAALLREARPRDITLDVGVLDRPGQAAFRQYAGIGLSTTSPEIIAEHAASDATVTTEFRDYEIPVTTLAAIVREHPLPHVHFLKIDVEGSEYEVLAGNDWEAFRPELICIETNHIVRDWVPLLSAASYRKVFDDGLNAYFLAAESNHRAESFDYASDVLEGGYLLPPVVIEQLELLVVERQAAASARQLAEEHRQAAEEHRRSAEEHHQAAGQLRLEITRLRADRTQLQDELDQVRSELVAETSLREMYYAREAMVTGRLAEVEAYLGEVLSSHSWRMTKPLRIVMDRLRRRAPGPAIGLARRTRDLLASTPAEPGRLSPDGMRTLADLELLAALEDDA
jgi:FkbM family methyltransferase